MPQTSYTRLVIRRPSGATELIGRPGVMSLADAAAMVSAQGMGTLVSVRHGQASGTKHVTTAVYDQSAIAAATKPRAI